jgi:hypothetical protein
MVEGKGYLFETYKGYFILFDETLGSSDFPFLLELGTVMDVRLHVDDKRNELSVERCGIDYADLIVRIEQLLIKGVASSLKPQSLNDISKSSVSYLSNNLSSLAHNDNKEVIERILKNIDGFTTELIEELKRKGNIREFGRGLTSEIASLCGLYVFSEAEVYHPSKDFLSYVNTLFHEKQKISISEAKMIETIKKKETFIEKSPKKPNKIKIVEEKPPIYIEANFLANFSEGFNELIEKFGLTPVMAYLKNVGGIMVGKTTKVSLDNLYHYSFDHVVCYDLSNRSCKYLEREKVGYSLKEKGIDALTTEEREKYDSICSEKVEKLRTILTARRENIIRGVEDISPIEVTAGTLMYLESHKNVRKTELETKSRYSDKLPGYYPSFSKLYDKWLNLGWLKEDGEYVVITPKGSKLLIHLSNI